MDSWNDALIKDTRFDPLLDALILISKLYGTPYTREALLAGLPVEDGKLDLDNFIVAAERANLSSRLLKKPISEISELTLPAILLLKDRHTAILLSLDKENKTAKIMRPECGESEETISLENLEKEYLGYVFLIKQKHRFDSQSEETLTVKVDHWFWGTLAKSWKIYRDVMLASVLVNLIVLASPLFTRNVYDRVIPNAAMSTLWTFTIGITIAYSFDFIMRMVRAYFIDIAGKKSDVMLSSLMFRKIQSIELKDRPKSVGSAAKELQEFDSVRELITSSTMTLIIDMPFTLLFLVVIGIMGGKLVIVPIVAMILILGFSLYVHNSIKYAVEQTYKAGSEKNSLLIETLNSPESVRAYNMQSNIQKKWEDATGEIAGWNVKSKLLSTSVGSFANYVQQMATVSTVVYGVYLIQSGHLSMGGLIAVMMLLGRTIAPMRQLASLITRVHSAKTAFASLEKLMEKPVEMDSEKSYISRKNFTGSYEFKEVSFAYPDAEIKSLHNVSFKIEAGQKLGILGRIGSGKSTIGKLLMRYYLPTEGAIYIDGIDIRQINPYELRNQIGYVPQHVQLFFGTVKENITLGATYVDDKRVEMVARLAGVTDFTDKHPLGLDLPVGEAGQNLSGGQRQLVALARALLLFPKILILDEPSSGMDLTTETALKNRLSEIMKDRTVIIATHRPSLLGLVDTIMVLEAGQVAAYGDKDEVFAQLKASGSSS
jgi:ATP-binding cassette subfamily C protein LapB